LHDELDEEIRAHFRMATEARVERGENPADAEQNARREFGNELIVREVTRDMWGGAAWKRFGQDLKYALRQMGRTPGFTAAALLTLALGLGATTTIFSIVNGVLLQPLGFRQPEHSIWRKIFHQRALASRATSPSTRGTFTNGGHIAARVRMWPCSRAPI